MHAIPKSLGRRIAECRERLGWTQKTLAERSGLSITFVSEIENDHRSPGTDALRSLAEALGASLDYLVKGMAGVAAPPRPLVIPPELADAAEEGGWSLLDAFALVRIRDSVFSRRSRGGEIDRADRDLSKSDWQELHELYVRLIREDDGAPRS